MTVRDYIRSALLTSDDGPPAGYLAQHTLFDQVPSLARDIYTPDYCVLGENGLEQTNAWLGPKGTVSPLHHDPARNLLAQVVGAKYLRLYAPATTLRLYPHPDTLLHNTSMVDVEAPDLARFPLFADAPYLEAVLLPGEMLYIPPHYWHYVRSLSVSFSVSFWWT
eukprot:m.24718 g.24718  ORF g.24718 m.24718 type:complete len:165 (+) comp4048_c0_seq2:326-820(+)